MDTTYWLILIWLGIGILNFGIVLAGSARMYYLSNVTRENVVMAFVVGVVGPFGVISLLMSLAMGHPVFSCGLKYRWWIKEVPE